MRIFDIGHHLDAALETPTEGPCAAMAFRFLPEYMPAGFKCCDCGAVRLFRLKGGTGYARVDGNQLCCYECADARQREDLRDQSKPFYAYVSGDGRKVITWNGGELGTVYNYAESSSGWRGSTIARFRVRDVHGNYWQGRGGGRGMCCTLRKLKGRIVGRSVCA